MTPHDLIVAALVLLAASVALICGLGAARIRDELPKIHMQAPITAFCLPVIAIALSLDAPLTPTMAKGLLLGVVSLLFSPITSHALARAAHHRAAGRPPRTESPRVSTDEAPGRIPPPEGEGPEVPAP